MPRPDVFTLYFMWDNTYCPFMKHQPDTGGGDASDASPTRRKPNTPRQRDLNKLYPCLNLQQKNYYNTSEVQLEETFRTPAPSQGLSPGVQKPGSIGLLCYFPARCLEFNIMQSAILIKIISLMSSLKCNGGENHSGQMPFLDKSVFHCMCCML